MGAGLYALSLPERVGRGLVGSAAGLIKETAEALVPDGMKRSRLYGLTVGKSLRFLIEEVGQVEGAYQDKEGDAGPVQEAYIVRKALGNAVDMGALAVFHISPVFALAVLSDCAFGVRTYLRQLAEELQSLGVLESADSVQDVEGLISSLERSSGTLADSLDTPPLSVKELRRTVEGIRRALKETRGTGPLKPEVIEELWEEMRRLAEREKRPLLSISSALAMNAANMLNAAGLGLYGSVKAAYSLVDGVVLSYYREGLRTIREKGWWATVRENWRPYSETLKLTFDPRRKSLTEKLFSSKGPLARFFKKLSRLFRRTPEAP